ncbi:MAG: hypothetical protein M1829_004191 [Trizodia sp. TS-e1964]|nr:MAG: hypothetical protein M1829_004191 [Trizodia sp. TS-e1964]
MPTRRRAAPPPPPPPEKRPRASKLAKEHNLSAAEELEIHEAFALFAAPHPDWPSEKAGVIPASDVRRALIALNIAPRTPAEAGEILAAVDPTGDGVVPFAPFVAVCALKLRARPAAVVADEVDDAYALFTRGTPGPITLQHLRRVANELRENVSDQVLLDMLAEAGGGKRGVGKAAFESVMRRAGVFAPEGV